MPCWRRATTFRRVTLVFVDNGSTDDSLEVAQKWVAKHLLRFEHATVVSRPNLGYGTGNDYAIRNCDTEFALVTNIDVAFHCDMLSTLVDFARHDDADVASWEARQYPFEHPKYYDPVTLLVNWQSHACVLFRRSAYLAAGGYDPALFMYGEDVRALLPIPFQRISIEVRPDGSRIPSSRPTETETPPGVGIDRRELAHPIPVRNHT